MEEGELDEWFNEQKEKLEERFYTEANTDVAKAKARFDVDYKKLIVEFQKKQDAIYDHKLRMAKMQAPFTRFAQLWRLRIELLKQWYAERKQALRKWFFDRKIRKILRDHSDR